MKLILSGIALGLIWLTLFILAGLQPANAQIIMTTDEVITVTCQPKPNVPPSSPFFDPDPPDCGVIDPPVGYENGLVGAQTTLLNITPDRSSVLFFYSSDGGDVDSITIDWESDNPVAVSVSQCPSDYDLSLPRACLGGSDRGTINMTSNPAERHECQLEQWRKYFVSFSAQNILTGESTCNDFACEVAVTVTLNRL